MVEILKTGKLSMSVIESDGLRTMNKQVDYQNSNNNVYSEGIIVANRPKQFQQSRGTNSFQAGKNALWPSSGALELLLLNSTAWMFRDDFPSTALITQ